MKKKSKYPITLARLKQVLSYDPVTGLFTWNVDAGRRRRGDIAGCVEPRGYIHIGIDGAIYRGHQLAWLYMTGEWPETTVDHENRIRGDNRWENLRPATMQQQAWNRANNSNSASGIQGVSARNGKWFARIMVSGKYIGLGTFDNSEKASAAYKSARELYHDFNKAS